MKRLIALLALFGACSFTAPVIAQDKAAAPAAEAKAAEAKPAEAKPAEAAAAAPVAAAAAAPAATAAPAPVPNKGDTAWMIVATVLVILIYAIAFSHLGFFVSTFLLMFFLFKTIGGMKWKASLAGAILTSCCFYLVFKVWLKVQFPEGPLGM